MNFYPLLFVGIGGAFGAIGRYILSVKFSNPQQTFPLATFIANNIGAILIGVFFVILVEKPLFNLNYSENLRQLLMLGFLGALTTYSSFSLEVIHLIDNGIYKMALIYVLATLISCLTLTYLAFKITKIIL